MSVDDKELEAWVASFRSAAAADGGAALTAHLRKWDLQGEPELLLEGTIDCVVAAAAFATTNGQGIVNFLSRQHYHPAKASGSPYAVTFDFYGRGFARVFADQHLRCLDLADLYAMPWERYQLVGYPRFWVCRVDGDDLSSTELGALEQDIASDLRFDYGEDELDFWFDRDSLKGALLVHLQDHIDIEQ